MALKEQNVYKNLRRNQRLPKFRVTISFDIDGIHDTSTTLIWKLDNNPTLFLENSSTGQSHWKYLSCIICAWIQIHLFFYRLYLIDTVVIDGLLMLNCVCNVLQIVRFSPTSVIDDGSTTYKAEAALTFQVSLLGWVRPKVLVCCGLRWTWAWEGCRLMGTASQTSIHCAL
jgi:hypothetical protein